MRVALAKSGRSFPIERRQSVLEAALQAGLNLGHRCKSGRCGACTARVLGGSIHYPRGRPLGLSDAQAADGLALMCQARTDGDLELEVFESAPAAQTLIKRLPGRIELIELKSHDVAAVYLRLPPAEPFDFRPGQYVDILLPRGRRRSFSIASPPHDARPLELHIRHAPGGEFTGPLFAGGASGGLIDLQGPLGHFVYREPTAGGDAAPVLLVGGGTGLAPLMSILRHITERGAPRDLTLYWGVRGERDLYAHDWLERRARHTPGFRYVPVLSEPSPAWRGRSGWVHTQALAELGAGLARCEVYASGPPAMIEALRRDFAAHGLPEDRLTFDAFDYAPDTLDRQHTRADTSA